MSEIQKTVEFVRDQRHHARNWRDWKRRLAAFGFAIEKTGDGPMIMALPHREVICALPRDLRV
jgi:ribose 5-phosphate isomerase RpiB